MEKEPLVSIITTTYNHEKFIGQCIESVLAQSYPHWEQIIIDDGSTDRTREVVAQYEDERIKYIRQENVGIWRLDETCNKALQLSQGKLIAFLDGDDFWPPYKLGRQVPVFDRQEVVLSWGRLAFTNSEGETILIYPKNLKWFKNRAKKEVIRKLLLENFVKASTAMCRKDALLSIGGFKQPEGVPYVDYPTWLELSLVGEFAPVDEMLCYRRRHEGQASVVVGLSMAEGRRYSMDFLECLPPEFKSLIGLSRSDLLAAYKARIASAYFFALGRIALSQGKREEAKRYFEEAFSNGSFSAKLKSLVGLTCAYCKVDMEWLAPVMHKPRLKE